MFQLITQMLLCTMSAYIRHAFVDPCPTPNPYDTYKSQRQDSDPYPHYYCSYIHSSLPPLSEGQSYRCPSPPDHLSSPTSHSPASRLASDHSASRPAASASSIGLSAEVTVVGWGVDRLLDVRRVRRGGRRVCQLGRECGGCVCTKGLKMGAYTSEVGRRECFG